MDTLPEIDNTKMSVECLSENLQKLLDFHKMNESELAKHLKLPYNTIHRLLTGSTSDPRISTVQQIADYFGVTLDYFMSKNPSTPYVEQRNRAIPVLDWDLIQDPNFMSQIETTTHNKWMQVTQVKNQQTPGQFFAIESTKSMYQRFSKGSTFIVKINEKPLDGDLVLIRFKDNSVSLRELIIDSPDWQLKAIVPGSASLIYKSEENTIIGVVTLTIIQSRPEASLRA